MRVVIQLVDFGAGHTSPSAGQLVPAVAVAAGSIFMLTDLF